MSEGIKFDGGKRLWRLFKLRDFEPAIKVGEYGAKKYAIDNWKQMKDPGRYEDALFRHVAAWQEGELVDPESGLPHLAHVLWNAVALCWFERRAHPDLYQAEPKDPPQKSQDDWAEASNPIAPPPSMIGRRDVKRTRSC